MNRASGGEYRLSLLGSEVSFLLRWAVSDGSRRKRERRNGIWIEFGWEVMMVDDYIGESTTSLVSGDYSG